MFLRRKEAAMALFSVSLDSFNRLKGDIKRLEESITKLVDRVSKIEGKVDGVVMTVSSISAGKQ